MGVRAPKKKGSSKWQGGQADGRGARRASLRVGASVGHGQQTGLVVLQLEVLVGELLAVDGLATGAVAAGEVTTLKHEVRDDAVEGGALVAEALLAGAEGTEVLGGLGDDVVEQVEGDAAGLVWREVSAEIRVTSARVGRCGIKEETREGQSIEWRGATRQAQTRSSWQERVRTTRLEHGAWSCS